MDHLFRAGCLALAALGATPAAAQVGAPLTPLVHVATFPGQATLRVVADDTGNFAVVKDDASPTSGGNLVAWSFDRYANLRAGPFQVNSAPIYDYAGHADFAFDRTGALVAAWLPQPRRLVARRLTAYGAPLTPESLVADEPAFDGCGLDVDTGKGGSFVVAWSCYRTGASGAPGDWSARARYRTFGGNAEALGPALSPADPQPATAVTQKGQDVAVRVDANADGSFMLLWLRHFPGLEYDGTIDLIGRRFTRQGVPADTELYMAVSDRYQLGSHQLATAGLASPYVLAWQQDYDYRLRLQGYSAADGYKGPELSIPWQSTLRGTAKGYVTLSPGEGSTATEAAFTARWFNPNGTLKAPPARIGLSLPPNTSPVFDASADGTITVMALRTVGSYPWSTEVYVQRFAGPGA